MPQAHFFSDHAKSRMRQMSVDPMKIYKILDRPEVVYPDPDRPERKRVVGDDIIVVTAPGRHIVTVLWRLTDPNQQRYDRKDPSTWPKARTA